MSRVLSSIAVVSSWSGGKDSCLACHKAISAGYNISYLVNFTSQESNRVSFHGTQSQLIHLQASAIGIPLIQKETTKGGYEQEFKKTVKNLPVNNIGGIVFGDIYLQEHKDWTKRICTELGIKSIQPLWGKNTKKVLLEFIDSGFEATIVSAKYDLFDKEWIGHKLDRKFLRYLQAKNIDACGENGEFHTFVTDGPIFKKRIVITEKEFIIKEGFWKHWFLDIKNCKLVEK